MSIVDEARQYWERHGVEDGLGDVSTADQVIAAYLAGWNAANLVGGRGFSDTQIPGAAPRLTQDVI